MIKKIYTYIIGYYKGRKKIIVPNSVIKRGTVFFRDRLKIESYVYIGPSFYINAKGGVIIQEGAIIGPNLCIWTVNHNYESEIMIPYDEVDFLKKVVIGKGVWIGEGVKICPGVNIGIGAVVSMGSVVTKDIPANTLVAGNPARVIKSLDEDRLDLINSRKYYLKLKTGNKIDKIVK